MKPSKLQTALQSSTRVLADKILWSLVVIVFLTAADVSAATYYIDYVAGADSNAGTSSVAPWKRHPYMNGFSGSYSHAAGDRFIFKGGVTWPNAAFRMNIPAGGTSGNRDYYGVSNAWYAGSSFAKPIFDGGAARITGGGNMFITTEGLNPGGNITFDNLQFQRFYWDANDGTFGAFMVRVEMSTNVVIQNCLFTNWTHGTAVSGTHDYHFCTYMHGANSGAGNIVSNCVFDGRPNGADSMYAVYQIPHIYNCRVGNMSNGLLPGGQNAEVTGNIVGPINNSFDATTHENNIETIGSGSITIANNIMFNDTAVCFLTSSDAAKYYFYNNLITNVTDIAVQWDMYTSASTTSEIYMWNNTIVPNGNNCVRLVDRGYGSFAKFVMQNNHFITDMDVMYRQSPGAGTTVVGNNITNTPATATAQGYTVASAYAATSSSGGTVDKGTSAPAGVFTQDIKGISRPQGAAWDVGVYEFSSGGVATNQPPVVSAITNNATDVDSVTAGLQVYPGTMVQFSGAATDPNGDLLTWQWIYVVNSGSEVVYQSGTGTVTATSYAFPASSAGSNYVWKLRASDGVATAESQLSVGVTALPAPTTTNWYVDNLASGANNGKSWANAWTAPAQIVWGTNGVKAGDTLYISGGSASKVYTNVWSVGASGTAGSPITIALDATNASHNGTVIFDYSSQGTTNANDFGIGLQNRQYVVLDGNVNGNSHFQVRHLRNILTRQKCTAFDCSGGDNITFRYITVTNCNNGISAGCRLVENCQFLKMAGDYSINATHNTVQNWDQIVIRRNYFESAYNTAVAPGGSGNWTGPDGVWADHGVTICSNVFKCTQVSYYTSSQHTDYIQATGNYIKVYDNEFINIGESAFDYDCYANANPHDLWIHNNLFRITDNLDPYPEYFRLYTSLNSVASIRNIKILNNTFVDNNSEYRVLRFDTFNANPTASGNEIKNNIFYNCGGASAFQPLIYIENSSGFDSNSFAFDANVYYKPGGTPYIMFRGTSYAAAAWVSAFEPKGRTTAPTFVSYTAFGTTNNYHLQAGDSAAKDAGLDFSGYATADKDGVLRPQGSAWDIGAYEYNGPALTNLPPVVSAIAHNSTDIDPVAPGLQVYPGAVVQYSGTASDPNGDLLTWQWIYTVNGGAEIVFGSGTGAVATITYTYPAGAAGSNYVWKLRVTDGLVASESQLTVGVEAPPVVVDGLTFQAESGVVTAPFVVTGGYLSQPAQTGVAAGGRAVYTFTVTNAGNCVIQALVNAPGDAANSFYVNIDAEPQDPAMVWQIPVTSGFENRIVNWQGSGTYDNPQYVPKVFSLTVGTHQLIIRGREANTQLDQISILMLPEPPKGFRILP